MHADTVDLVAIFGQQVRYLIPQFQRPYVWDEQDQWQPLWDDIVLVLERQLDDTPANDAIPHFLGAVVLDQLLTPTGMIGARYVIDGQQRLTTLQIFLAAARDVAVEAGLPRQAAALGKLLFNDDFLVKSPADRFKLVPSKWDREAFREAIEGDTPAREKGHHLMHRAYRFFRDRVREWAIADGEPEAVAARFEILSTVLWKLMSVVAIDLEARDNAQVIFETLNARGTPLLASDLIKNLLFLIATTRGHDADDLYVRYWEVLDSEWWRKEVVTGRLKRPRLDVFANHWLAMKLRREVVSHLLFPDFKRYVTGREHEVVEILADFRRFADVWAQFENWSKIEDLPADEHVGGAERKAREADRRRAEFFYRIRIIELTTAYPVLLWLSGPDGIADDDERLRAFRAIESWVTRRVITRGNTQGYTQIFVSLLKTLAESETPSAAVVVAYLRSLEGERGYWPTDEQVGTALRAQPLYQTIIRARLRMILEAVDWRLSDAYSEKRAPTGLSIEHVLPQEWREHWDDLGPDGPERDQAVARREILKHTVGNLTLVTPGFNPKLSNKAWPVKQAEFRKHSLLRLSSDVRAAASWGEAEILQRSDLFAAEVMRVWPAADDASWGSV